MGLHENANITQAIYESNEIFANILELCRQGQVEHLVYALSSSVYELNSNMPFSTLDCVDHPISRYAATKKSNELMAYSYSHRLWSLGST